MKTARLVFAGLIAVASAVCAAQTWSPQKNVEIVAASAPGGSNDNTARTLERIFSMHKLVPVTLTVVNKPGGGATIAHTYVNQRAGDPHYLLIRSEEHTSELQSPCNLVCRLLLEKKKQE